MEHSHLTDRQTPSAFPARRSFSILAGLIFWFCPGGSEAADQGSADSAAITMVRIPGGEFLMGDSVNEGLSNEFPPHWVSVAAFSLAQTEVTHAQWREVHTWSQRDGRGYDFAAGQCGSTLDYDALPATPPNDNHPVTGLSWWDAVKWCNAKSRKDGFKPCYYTDAGLTTELVAGSPAVHVDWTANGYRLPTEAEWEFAARGGLPAKSLPWGQGLHGSKANYYDSADPFGGTTPAGYYNGNQVPAGPDMKNGYGLADMAGNVWEWCWDWLGPYTVAKQTDPHGPAAGTDRVIRGGAWDGVATVLRCAYRDGSTPEHRSLTKGFRPARTLP